MSDADLAAFRALLDSPKAREFARRAPRLGHTYGCRCSDCGIEATRRHIAEMECELGMCDHGPHDRHVLPMPRPSARPERTQR